MFDSFFDYRICHYNHGRHGGTHLHRPARGPASLAVDIQTCEEAVAIMQQYHDRHTTFSHENMKEEIEAWKSAFDAA